MRPAVVLSLFFSMAASTGSVAHPSVASAQNAAPVLGVFEGTTPCHNIPRPLPHIPEDIDCELMTWNLTLYLDPGTGNPATFKLISAYGLTQPNTPGIRGGGTRVQMEGRWTITRGTNSDPDAVVYTLNPDNPSRSVSFVKLDDYLLHVLGRDRGLMVGNGGWSYTLNRTDKSRGESSPRNPNPASRLPVAQLPTGSSTFGVFGGRTNCSDVALQFTGFPAPDCRLIKWRLTLYQDPATGAPTTFNLKGTRGEREGTWSMVRGTRPNPAAVVYRLVPDNPQQSASFLKADDNTLLLLDRDSNPIVGDPILSNTLSRVDGPVSSCFADTGRCLRGIFRRYWERSGGLARFGFPISPELVADGRTVQYTQRARLEWHPENAGTRHEVLLGRLGASIAEARAARGERPFQRVSRPAHGSALYFPETGHTLAPPLRAYWEANGGLPVFGYPLSEAFQERSATDGNTYLVQYFERNRLEYHPENRGTPSEVLLGLLGVQEYERRYRQQARPEDIPSRT
ncbi:MAG TPA: copper resistance protein NlpE N-terminal domain-containing protein [Chloroflexia bacterium]|nr:copper resistance protein NlpE N-terminal domain-containing protein [Chloroflexia bacterium]